MLQKAVFLAVAILTAAAWTAGLPAETYYKCEAGYTFTVKDDAAQCKRAAYYEYVALNPCPSVGGVGLFLAVDRVTGGKDQCAGTNPVTGTVSVDPTCRTGYTWEVRAGADRCRKLIAAAIKAPSVVVNK